MSLMLYFDTPMFMQASQPGKGQFWMLWEVHRPDCFTLDAWLMKGSQSGRAGLGPLCYDSGYYYMDDILLHMCVYIHVVIEDSLEMQRCAVKCGRQWAVMENAATETSDKGGGGRRASRCGSGGCRGDGFGAKTGDAQVCKYGKNKTMHDGRGTGQAFQTGCMCQSVSCISLCMVKVPPGLSLAVTEYGTPSETAGADPLKVSACTGIK